MRLAPQNGTSAPGMGAADSTGQSGAALFGKSKRALLALFYVQPERSFYLRQIMRTLGIGQGAVQRELARLVDGEVYLSDLEGRADVLVEYRPDYSPCWYPWRSFYVCAATGEGLSNQYRCRIGLGEPTAKNCVEFNNKPSREARFFQIRVTINGHCVFMGAKLGAVPIPEPEFAPPLCNK